MLFLRVMFARASFIEKKLVVSFCWNLLIGAPGTRLFKKIINPSKILASVKLMYSYQEKIASTVVVGHIFIWKADQGFMEDREK